MTSPAATARQAVRPRPSPGTAADWETPDARRRLQLALAALWLLDGVLQYQPFMFSKAFSRMLAGAAAGNPAVIADPITWSARIIAHHPTAANAAFATIQLALGLGIAWRRSARVALAASIAWSLAVWWLGEGLGGVLTGGASPVSGAPGAVILYALLAVLLWPAAGGGSGSFVAARPVGARAARAAWLVLWGSLAYFAVQAGNRTAQGLHDLIAAMAGGEPAWLASIDQDAARALAHHGLLASVVLSVVLAAIAVGIYLPAPAVRVAIAAALVVSAVIWVVGQDLGAILAGGATDVNSGPLLMLTALAYWPLSAGRPVRDGARVDPAGPVPGTAR
ncbi:MAG TPA: hypothetical protein VMV07_06085 [Streptosporangiaceae bacterium]|nr:hypothetical protein [Streptosporangiaceae bacterium]